MEMDKQVDPKVMENRAHKQEVREFCDPDERGQRREVIKHYTEGGIDTFIREYPKHAPDKFCDLLMGYADSLKERKIANERTPEITASGNGAGEFNRKDFFFFLTEGTSPNLRNTMLTGWSKLASQHYIDEFSQLGANDFWMSAAKVQITNPSEGFHGWHYDNSGFFVGLREFVFITYLNDVPAGGETEFLYQGIRIAPKKGTTVIFPASYTHMHRGNPPLGCTKYIATTWASRLPRIDEETQGRDEIECIAPMENVVQYYKKN